MNLHIPETESIAARVASRHQMLSLSIIIREVNEMMAPIGIHMSIILVEPA
jgi:hypothetical protein